MILLSLRVVFAVVCILCRQAVGKASSNVTETTVAFEAGLDADLEVQGSQIIVYKKVLLNFGGGYNNKTGIFTATKSGVYVFHIHALANHTFDFWVALYHNNEYVISSFAGQTSNYDAGSNTAILRLKKNDTVYVKTRRTGRFFGRPQEIYATFSGYRIGVLHDGDQ